MKEGWKEFRLNELIKINNGKNYSHLNEGKTPVYGSGGIMCYVDSFLHDGEAVLLPRKGTLNNILYTKGRIWTVDTMYYATVNENANSYYLYCYLNILKLDQLDSGSSLPSMTQSIYYNVKVKLPELKVQQRIASILSAYDDLIEVNNKRIELLEQSARELYKEWFVRMRFPNYQKTKFNKGIPEGWEEKSPFDISEVLYGYPFNSSLFNENEGIPVVRIRDIIANSKTTFTIEKIDGRYLLNDGDILIGMDGDFHIQRWMNGIAYINQRVVRLRAKTDCIYNSCFIENVIREPIFFLNSIIVGTTVAHLSDKDMKKIKLLIPTNDLIIKFKILTDPVTETIITLFKQNQQLTEIRNSLLPRLISGKLEIKEKKT